MTMSGITVSVSGDFKNLERFLKNASRRNYRRLLEDYGRKGVDALSMATPVDSGITASSWSYDISETSNGFEINWNNSNVNDGVNIAIILQYGHGTGTGGYVQGRDYINPALQSVFDGFVDDLTKAVNNG